MCCFYTVRLESALGNAQNQTANAAVITDGQFSEPGKMSFILQNHISSCCITEPKSSRSGFDVLNYGPAQPGKHVLKTGTKKSVRKRKCCCCLNPMGNRLHLIITHEYECCSGCP